MKGFTVVILRNEKISQQTSIRADWRESYHWYFGRRTMESYKGDCARRPVPFPKQFEINILIPLYF